MADISRLQVELDKSFMETVESLQTVGGLRTKKDVVENSLTMFKWAAQEKVFGCAIVAVNPKDGTYAELQMPVLEVIATKGAGSRKKGLIARARFAGSTPQRDILRAVAGRRS
jgi:hypothetical protein